MRLVSLVPSLTESVAHTGFLVGATDYCVHPEGLDVAQDEQPGSVSIDSSAAVR